MRILIACEYSGIVRDAFRAFGHDAVSCDLIPTEAPGPHIIGDARKLLKRGRWDMLIAHPPCPFLTSTRNAANVRELATFDGRVELQHNRQEAVALFMAFANAPVDRIAIENPRGIMAKFYRPSDQRIHPYQFGHPERKLTCLWLKGLPLLRPTKIVTPHDMDTQFQSWYNTGGKNRAKVRAKTFPGIAEAMAVQWGLFL